MTPLRKRMIRKLELQRKSPKTQAITTCRTAAQGGRRQWRLAWGYERYVYFSCRNRHCPQCQTVAKETWRETRRRELLPVPYFHQVFTLPHQLNRLVLWSERNQRALLKQRRSGSRLTTPRSMPIGTARQAAA